MNKLLAKDYQRKAIALGLISGIFDSMEIEESIPELPIVVNIFDGINRSPVPILKNDLHTNAKINVLFLGRSFIKFPYFQKRFKSQNRRYAF